MRQITAPLTLGQTGAEVTNLQEILLAFYNAGLIIYDDLSIIDKLNDEQNKQFFGSATALLVNTFRAAHDIGSGSGPEVVNEATIHELNTVLGDLQPTRLTVSGLVHHSSGKKLSATYKAIIYNLTYGGAVHLDTVAVSETGGYQTIIPVTTDTIDMAQKNSIAVLIKAASSIDGTYTDTLDVLASGIGYVTDDSVVINLELIGSDIIVTSEYDDVKAALELAIGSDNHIIDVTLDEGLAELLASKTGEGTQQIKAMVTAYKIDQLLTIDNKYIYGILRQNISSDLKVLLNQPASVIIKALEASVASYIIPQISSSDIASIASQLNTAVISNMTANLSSQQPKDTPEFFIANHVLQNDDKTTLYVKAVVTYDPGSDQTFWQYLAGSPFGHSEANPFGFIETEIEDLKDINSIASFNGNNSQLAGQLFNQFKEQNLSMGRWITSVTTDELQAHIAEVKAADGTLFFYPDFVVGSNDTAKTSDYAKKIIATVNQIYPTEALFNAIQNTPFDALKQGLSSFLDHNSGFDLRTIPAAKIATSGYNLDTVENHALFIEQLGIAQRLMGVTTNPTMIAAMANNGLHSAVQITRQPVENFVTIYQSYAGSAEAAKNTYQAAMGNTAYLLTTLVDVQQQLANPNMRVLDNTLNDPNDTFADWRTLFGSLDGCNCSACQSVYSPAAYLTDLLQFLRSNLTPVYNVLIERRPDIKDIDLVCKNINTPVPHIDIVNELLEDIVSSVYYNIGNSADYKANSYKMYARQTIADANVQRAIPEYINTYPNDGMDVRNWNGTTYDDIKTKSPYPALQNAVYPSNLPYNFFKRQIDTHLDLTGIKSHELLQRFGATDELEGWNNADICAAYLGLSKEELDIILGNTPLQDAITGWAPNPTNPYAYFGLRHDTSPTAGPNDLYLIQDPTTQGTQYPSGQSFSSINWVDQLAFRVDIFIQQAQISYSELLTLLDCYCINPKNGSTSRKIAIENQDSSITTEICDLSKLKITGVDVDVMKKLYRFIRLKKALGWEYYDLDRALISLSNFAPTADLRESAGNITITNGIFIQLVQMDRLSKLLGLSITEIGLLYREIDDTLIYRDYRKSEPVDIPSLYKQMFRNSLVGNVNSGTNLFTIDAADLIMSDLSVDKIKLNNYLSGVFNIGAEELKVLTDNLQLSTLSIPAGGTRLTQLSAIYREILLLKALNLSVDEWITYRDWISVNTKFNASTSEDDTYEVNAAPFAAPYDTLRFYTLLRTSVDSNIDVPNLDYLLKDSFSDEAAKKTEDEQLAATLTTLRSELQKKNAPAYTNETDIDGTILKGLLQQIMLPEDADYMVKVIQNDPAISGDVLADRIDFLKDLRFPNNVFETLAPRFLSDSEVDTITTYSPANPIGGRAIVYAALKTQIENSTRRPSIISSFTKELKLDEEIVTTLLESAAIQTNIGTQPSPVLISVMDLLLRPDFVESNDLIIRDTNHAFEFAVTIRLKKAAQLINQFKLDLQDVINLWTEQTCVKRIFSLTELPVATTAGTTLMPYYKWIAFLRWVKVTSFLGKRTKLLYDAIKQIPSGKTETLKKIANAFSMPLADMETLVGTSGSVSTAPEGTLNVVFKTALTANAYNVSKLYLRLIDCLEMQQMLPSPINALAKIVDSIQHPESQEKANEIIQVVKAQYDDEQWLTVIRPVNDKLRAERRDAMVAWLIANPPFVYFNSWRTSNDIFETLMVDVDMMTCMSTTRILLAVNTIQLWVERVLLGLEKYVDTNHDVQPLLLSKPQARQWNMWRKLYRVWEANRQIFIYPENWIEPELRDDKSPFFLELEKFLKQNDLTDENVASAYQTYLERLEEVSHLEIVGICREIDADKRFIIHAFGRTATHPSIYYYRKRIDTEWQPWEKMDAQIDGDHFVPVIWQGKLRFYWLTFMKEQQEEATTNTNMEFPKPAAVRWKINLAFTEYKNNRWTPKQLSKDVLYTTYLLEEDPINTNHVENLSHSGFQNISSPEHPSSVDRNRNWALKGTLEKQKKENITFYSGVNDNDDLQLFLAERIKLISQKKMFETVFTISVDVNNNYHIDSAISNESLKAKLEEFKTEGFYDYVKLNQLGTFTHKFDKIVASTNAFSEHNLYYDDGDYEYWYASKDLCHHNYTHDYTRFRFNKKGAYNTNAISGYFHYPDKSVVQYNGYPLFASGPDTDTPGGKILDGRYIVLPLQKPNEYVEGNVISIPAFFYSDYKNNFFVERVLINNSLASHGNYNNQDYPILEGKNGAQAGLYFGLKYRFHEFKHGTVHLFREQLYKNGLDSLLDRDFLTSSALNDSIDFATNYLPNASYVLKGTNGKMYPNSKVDFSADGAYAQYNWELFYHIPMLIANKLMQDQKFEEARKWYQYVFNPSVGASTAISDYWNFPVFHDNATNIPTPLQLMNDSALPAAVDRWANDPFKPHLIARTRVSAYMKNTVMKYLDNLIGWGDMLFRTDTRENINEATLLYVLAAQLLGRKPTQIPARATPAVQTYVSLLAATGGLNAFSNGMVNAENYILSSGATTVSGNTGLSTLMGGSMLYFCIPQNSKLAAYWDTIADRLFKIHNCQNIDGIERELALYDPPIDPALLVKAAAAGLSLSDALADINSPLPAYRFNVMSQKATELTQEVKSLGGQLLSALEKKDAEQLALLRSSQELTLLDLVTEVKEQQVQDTVSQINGLQQQQKMTTQKRDYYQKLIDNGLNPQEKLNLDSLDTSKILTATEGTLQTLSGVFHAFPNVTGGTCNGVTFGGDNLGNLTGAAASAVGAVASINSINGQMASIKGSFARRKEDWDQQLKTANVELKQLDYQILGAQIRQAVAEMELRNHKVQLDNARQMDEAMHNKYTNEDLYEWMVSEISFTYFQAYKLALEVAKRAERCYRYELGLESSDFIQPAYWDSLKKGLLAGEQLIYDIKRMEVSFLEKNKRQFELTKHVSLATFFPDDLLELKTNSKCDIEIPEWIYDLDYPGHHQRRIKSVSISIPCVAGPYTTVSCKLSLVSSKYRKTGILATNNPTYNDDTNFKQLYGSIQSIATSHAQNDSGMFELSFRDERYLPFEGCGAISKWRIELPAAYAQFDFDSIVDAILHINYTALDEGGLELKLAAKGNVTTILTNAATNNGFMRMFDINHDFANEWQAYKNDFAQSSSASMQMVIHPEQFPYYTIDSDIEVLGFQVGINLKKDFPANSNPKLHIDYKNGTTVYTKTVDLTGGVAKIHPTLMIAGNKKILKISLKNSSGDPLNMDTYLDSLYLVALCRLQSKTTGTDDISWTGNGSTPLFTPVALGTPTLSATGGDRQVSLSWNAVTGHDPITGLPDSSIGITYVVEQSHRSTFPSYLTHVVYSGPDTSTIITGLTNGEVVYFRIKAISNGGDPDSGYSFDNATPQAATNGALATPTNLAANPRDTQVELSWLAVPHADNYLIKQDGTTIHTVTTLTDTITGLTNGTTYSFSVIAQGASYSDSIAATISATPTATSLSTSDMLAWWKADATDTVLASGGVDLWKDQSGHGNDIAAYSSGTRPAIVTNWQNNLPALHFNGAEALKMAMLTLPTVTTDVTVFIAGEKLSSVGSGRLFQLSDSLSTNNCFGYALNLSGNYDVAMIHDNVVGYNINCIPLLQTRDIKGIYVISFNSSDADPETSIEFNDDDTNLPYSPGYNQETGPFDSNTFNIGSVDGTSDFAGFKLAEMIILPHKADSSEREAVKNYLKNKYNL